MAAPAWVWMLGDANYTSLAELNTAAGRRVAYKRNTFSEASCTISADDAAAALLWGALRNTGVPTLRCYRGGVLRFKGYLAPFREDAEVDATIQLVFRSPFGRLLGDGAGSGRFVRHGNGIDPYSGAPRVYPGWDAGQIAYDLLALANTEGNTGLAGGRVEPTVVRDRAYDAGQNIGEAIINLTNVLDGFDFTEAFIDDPADATIAAHLDIAPSQGSDRPNARFEYGANTMANCRSFSRTVTPPVNLAYVQGAAGAHSVCTDLGSQAKYGVWCASETHTDISVQDTLDARARAMLRPSPIRTVQMAPDPGLGPRPWDDYGIGDTVQIYALRGAITEAATARVNMFAVVIDEDGTESFDVPDPVLPDEESSIRSVLEAEVVAVV